MTKKQIWTALLAGGLIVVGSVTSFYRHHTKVQLQNCLDYRNSVLATSSIEGTTYKIVDGDKFNCK